jgi:hypothetical protein
MDISTRFRHLWLTKLRLTQIQDNFLYVLNISSWEFSLRVVPPSFGTETAYRMGGLMNNFLNDFCTTWHLPNLGGAKVWMILVAHISANIYEACRFCTGAIFFAKKMQVIHICCMWCLWMSMNAHDLSCFMMHSLVPHWNFCDWGSLDTFQDLKPPV